MRIDKLDDFVAHTTDIVKNSNIIAMEREREREREKELVREILNEKRLNKKTKRESVNNKNNKEVSNHVTSSKFDHLMDENDNDKNRKTDNNNKNENKNKNDNENDLLSITRMMSSGSGSGSGSKVNSQDLLSSMSNYKKSNIMHTPSLVDDTDEEQVSLEIDEDIHHIDDEN